MHRSIVKGSSIYLTVHLLRSQNYDRTGILIRRVEGEIQGLYIPVRSDLQEIEIDDLELTKFRPDQLDDVPARSTDAQLHQLSELMLLCNSSDSSSIVSSDITTSLLLSPFSMEGFRIPKALADMVASLSLWGKSDFCFPTAPCAVEQTSDASPSRWARRSIRPIKAQYLVPGITLVPLHFFKLKISPLSYMMSELVL